MYLTCVNAFLSFALFFTKWSIMIMIKFMLFITVHIPAVLSVLLLFTVLCILVLQVPAPLSLLWTSNPCYCTVHCTTIIDCTLYPCYYIILCTFITLLCSIYLCYCTMLYTFVTVLFYPCIVLYFIVLYCTLCTVLYCIILLYFTVYYCVKLCCTGIVPWNLESKYDPDLSKLTKI